MCPVRLLTWIGTGRLLPYFIRLASRDGIRSPRSHMAYFPRGEVALDPAMLEVGSVRRDKKTRHATSKSARAWSKVGAVPPHCSPGSEPG